MLKKWYAICYPIEIAIMPYIKEVRSKMTVIDRSVLYTSAAFTLESPGIPFQFKLRRSQTEPLFALVHKNSRALACLKTGTLLPMTFYYPDRTIPPEKRETRIKYIRDVNVPGFDDHVIVALDINDTGRRGFPVSGNL